MNRLLRLFHIPRWARDHREITRHRRHGGTQSDDRPADASMANSPPPSSSPAAAKPPRAGCAGKSASIRGSSPTSPSPSGWTERTPPRSTITCCPSIEMRANAWGSPRRMALAGRFPISITGFLLRLGRRVPDCGGCPMVSEVETRRTKCKYRSRLPPSPWETRVNAIGEDFGQSWTVSPGSG